MFDSSALDTYLTGLCEKKALPGVSAAILGPNGLEYAFNYGCRDGASLHPVDNDTLFGIASMSKSMTALCACILACEGKLDLNAPVSDFFPEFELAGQPREAATVRMLAMHTAGIPPMEPLEWSIAMNSEGRSENDWLHEMKRTAPNNMETIDEIIDYIAHCGYNTLGAPGEVMSYSNEGYAILSYVIDKAAGMPLEQFMQERIFAPLGMTRSILDNGIDAARALSGGNITSLFEIEDGVRTCDDCWSVLPPFRGCAMVKSTSRDMATIALCPIWACTKGGRRFPRTQSICSSDAIIRFPLKRRCAWGCISARKPDTPSASIPVRSTAYRPRAACCWAKAMALPFSAIRATRTWTS